VKIRELITETLAKKDIHWTSIHKFLEEFGQYSYPSIDQHEDLKCYAIHTWVCTDTLVGYFLYTFKDEPCCITSQTGRKNDVYFHWISEEKYFEVLKFCLQFVQPEKPFISTFDLDAEDETLVDKYYLR